MESLGTEAQRQRASKLRLPQARSPVPRPFEPPFRRPSSPRALVPSDSIARPQPLIARPPSLPLTKNKERLWLINRKY